MQEKDIQAIVEAVLAEINAQSNSESPHTPPIASAPPTDDELVIDLPDPTTAEARKTPGVQHAAQPDAVSALMATTPTRIGVGRAGPRPRTRASLLFQADHGVTQDALFHPVDESMLAELGIFTVQSQARGRQEYLKRPDLGRVLSEESRKILRERCVKNPDVQIFIGDGLSGAAIDHNLPKILPVLKQGLDAAGLSMGTVFFVQNARVGLLNDVNAIVDAKVCAILIGERPGLARAESMSIYLGYRPQPNSTDAHRDAICNIYDGGFNPLEAGAFAVQLIQKMMQYQTSGVDLKLTEKNL